MTQITHYDIGDYWRPEASFAVGGVLTDPTTITVKVQDPAGVETLSSATPGSVTLVSTPIARTNTGTYVLTQALDSAGHGYARFEGAGAVVATHTHEAIVDPDPFTNESGVSTRALVSLGETKDWLASCRSRRGRREDRAEDQRRLRGDDERSWARVQAERRRLRGPAPSTSTTGTPASARSDRRPATTSSASTLDDDQRPRHGHDAADFGNLTLDSAPRSRAPWEPVTQHPLPPGARRAFALASSRKHHRLLGLPAGARPHSAITRRTPSPTRLDRDAVRPPAKTWAQPAKKASEGGRLSSSDGSPPSCRCHLRPTPARSHTKPRASA